MGLVTNPVAGSQCRSAGVLAECAAHCVLVEYKRGPRKESRINEAFGFINVSKMHPFVSTKAVETVTTQTELKLERYEIAQMGAIYSTH